MRQAIVHAVMAALVLASAGSAEKTSSLEAALKLTSKHGADVVLMLSEKHITVGDDGRVLERTREIQRILTDHGLDAHGDPIVSFNSELQDARVKVAQTLRTDGAITGIKPNAINVVTPDAVARAPHFTDVKDMAITFLGLEKGAATELEVEVEDFAPYRRVLWGTEPLWDDRETMMKVVSISVPVERDITWFVTGASVTPEVEHSDGSVTYRFSVADTLAVNVSAIEGVSALQLPTLYWVEKVGAEALARRLLGGAPIALDPSDADAAAAADEIVCALETQFASETWTPREKVLGYYTRIAQGLATVEVDRRLFGDAVRAPLEAFRSGYADPLEKLGILHTVLARLGHDPEVLVELYHDPGSEARLHPGNIRGLWTRATVEGRYVYLDALGTSRHGEPRADDVFILDRKGERRAEYVKPASTRMKLDLVVDLSCHEPVASGSLVLRGSQNPYWGMIVDGQPDPLVVVTSMLGPMSDLIVKEASFTHLALDETAIDFLAVPGIDDGLLDTTLPGAIMTGPVDRWETWRPERGLPIEIDEAAWEKVRIEVRLPDGARVLHAPSFEEKTVQVGPLSLFHSVGIAPVSVSLVRRLTMVPGEVEPASMVDLVDFLSNALARSQNRLVVQLPLLAP